jgi:hypothetical protein
MSRFFTTGVLEIAKCETPKSRQPSISGGYVSRPITSEFRKSGDGDVKNSYYRSPEVANPEIAICEIAKRSGPSNHLECGLLIRLPFGVLEIGRWRCQELLP